MFQTPLQIDVDKTVEIPTPDAWKEELEPKTKIDVLPLVDGAANKRGYAAGWCTYTYACEECPELEVFCGGVNSKTFKAGAVWRQGNLLHFGFEQSPAELNATGRALLVNSIAYIARFTEDRPIARTPSPFVGPAPRSRESIARFLKQPQPPTRLKDYLQYFLSAELFSTLNNKDQEQIAKRYEEIKPFVRADGDGKLMLDKEAQAFGISPARLDFFPQAIVALEKDESERELARKLLARYVAAGPAGDATAATWQAWWSEHKPYLFFSDAGWYRWYIDPLAKKRNTPSQELRGSKRASLP